MLSSFVSPASSNEELGLVLLRAPPGFSAVGQPCDELHQFILQKADELGRLTHNVFVYVAHGTYSTVQYNDVASINVV